jgi:transposase
MNIQYRVDLSEAERAQLTALLNGGRHAARTIERDQILLAADAGVSDEMVETSVSVGGSTVYRTKRRFVKGNLSRIRLLDQWIVLRLAVATDSIRCGMGGKSPIVVSDDQRFALTTLAASRDRGEADRARAVLLTLAGWTSPRIAEAFGVRQDTVRLWRGDFGRGGVDALKASVASGPVPVKSATALLVVTPLLEEPVADRPN